MKVRSTLATAASWVLWVGVAVVLGRLAGLACAGLDYAIWGGPFRLSDGDFMGGTLAGFLLARWFFPGPAPEGSGAESAR